MLNLKILIEKSLAYITLLKITFKNYIFNLFLKTIIYILKLIIIFCF